jgi:hypothetical protein
LLPNNVVKVWDKMPSQQTECLIYLLLKSLYINNLVLASLLPYYRKDSLIYNSPLF